VGHAASSVESLGVGGFVFLFAFIRSLSRRLVRHSSGNKGRRRKALRRRIHSRFVFLQLLLPGVDDGAAHVAGFQGFVHEVIEMGGVFPGFSAAFFDQFGA
jgi:hypothetical protein